MSKKCTHCNPQSAETMQKIPLISAECEATRQHQIVKGLICVNILLIALLAANFVWTVYSSQPNVIYTGVESGQNTEITNSRCVIQHCERWYPEEPNKNIKQTSQQKKSKAKKKG